MKIETLQHFITLAQAASFYRASKASNLTVQGYAKMLSSLERELGAKLAIRDREGIHLTRAGEILLEYALDVTDGLSRTIERIAAEQIDKPDGNRRFKMHLTHWPMQVATHLDHLRHVLKAFDFREEPFEQVVALAENPVGDDTFFIDVYSEATIEMLNARMIGYEPLYHAVVGVAVRGDSPAASFSLIPKSTMAGLDLAYYPHKEWNRKIDEVFLGNPITNIRLKTTGIRVLFDYAKEDGHRGVLTDAFSFYALQKSELYDLRGFVFVPLGDNAAKFSAGMIYTRNHPPTAKVQAIMDYHRKLSLSMARDYHEAYPLIARGVWNC